MPSMGILAACNRSGKQLDLGPTVHGIKVAEKKDTKGEPIMKHILRPAGRVVCALLLLLSMPLPAFAADAPTY